MQSKRGGAERGRGSREGEGRQRKIGEADQERGADSALQTLHCRLCTAEGEGREWVGREQGVAEWGGQRVEDVEKLRCSWRGGRKCVCGAEGFRDRGWVCGTEREARRMVERGADREAIGSIWDEDKYNVEAKRLVR